MNTVIIIGILVIFVAFLFLLHRMASKYVKFSTRVFTALAIGLVFGIVIQLLFEADSEITTVTMDWMNIVGSGYV